MPPVPITLHTTLASSSSGSSQTRTPLSPPIIIGRNRVAYVAYSIEDGHVIRDNGQDAQGSSSRPVNVYNTQHTSTTRHSSTTQHSTNHQHSSTSQHTAHNPAFVGTTQNPLPSASSSTRKSRKAVAYNVNDLDPDNFITLIPKTLAIIDRCFPPKSPSSSTSPDHSSSLQNNYSAPTADRWSRDLDLGNYRSNNPSPKEIARAKIKEAERAKARVEAAALKRERAKRNPKRRASGGTVTRNQSPVDNNNNKEGTPPLVMLNDSTTHMNSIIPPPPPTPDNAEAVGSTSFTSQPFPPRNGMKRTRSANLPPISSNLSNSLGPVGMPGISSPLRAVTGPNTPEEGDQLPHKRSRLSDPTDEIVGSGRSTPKEAALPTGSRKASSLSPTSTSKPPLPIDPTPNTIPSATLQLPLSLQEESQSMRRAASASNIGGSTTRASRRSSFGIEALQARERSKREVVLPERLKDYDVRSTTPAW